MDSMCSPTNIGSSCQFSLPLRLLSLVQGDNDLNGLLFGWRLPRKTPSEGGNGTQKLFFLYDWDPYKREKLGCLEMNDLFPICQSLRVTEALVGTQIWLSHFLHPCLSPKPQIRPIQPCLNCYQQNCGSDAPSLVTYFSGVVSMCEGCYCLKWLVGCNLLWLRIAKIFKSCQRCSWYYPSI